MEWLRNISVQSRSWNRVGGTIPPPPDISFTRFFQSAFLCLMPCRQNFYPEKSGSNLWKCTNIEKVTTLLPAKITVLRQRKIVMLQYQKPLPPLPILLHDGLLTASLISSLMIHPNDKSELHRSIFEKEMLKKV